VMRVVGRSVLDRHRDPRRRHLAPAAEGRRTWWSVGLRSSAFRSAS
jgi:hypothetical protein